MRGSIAYDFPSHSQCTLLKTQDFPIWFLNEMSNLKTLSLVNFQDSFLLESSLPAAVRRRLCVLLHGGERFRCQRQRNRSPPCSNTHTWMGRRRRSGHFIDVAGSRGV